jgi:ABC-type xylose transport system permease subunit
VACAKRQARIAGIAVRTYTTEVPILLCALAATAAMAVASERLAPDPVRKVDTMRAIPGSLPYSIERG